MTLLARIGQAALLLASPCAAYAAATPAPSATVVHARAAGALACGVLSEPGDYTMDDTHGPLLDFGADLCRAVAAATVGDVQKLHVAYLPDEQHGFAALQGGQIDLLFGATPRLTAGPIYGVSFGRPVFFDGQGFLVHRSDHITTLRDLANAQICFIVNTLAEYDLHDGMDARHLAFRPYPFSERGEMEAALVTGTCAVMTADISLLADVRAAFRSRAAEFDIVPALVTLDPISPAWRQDDPQFGRIVDSTVSALLQAEQVGLRRADMATIAARHDDAAQTLMRDDRAGAQVLGLSPGWSLHAIATVGNYAELFYRDLGDGSALHLPRGANALYTQGGLMYPLPSR